MHTRALCDTLSLPCHSSCTATPFHIWSNPHTTLSCARPCAARMYRTEVNRHTDRQTEIATITEKKTFTTNRLGYTVYIWITSCTSHSNKLIFFPFSLSLRFARSFLFGAFLLRFLFHLCFGTLLSFPLYSIVCGALAVCNVWLGSILLHFFSRYFIDFCPFPLHINESVFLLYINASPAACWLSLCASFFVSSCIFSLLRNSQALDEFIFLVFHNLKIPYASFIPMFNALQCDTKSTIVVVVVVIYSRASFTFTLSPCLVWLRSAFIHGLKHTERIPLSPMLLSRAEKKKRKL